MSDLTNTTTVKSTKLGWKVWLSVLLVSFVGQIAWSVENMYFATLAQDIFEGAGRDDLGYIITTIMVALSAITATATTIFAGGFIDKTGKRKPFIAYGYMAWGVTIMIFAALPMTPTGKMIAGVATMLIIFDCVMTFFGSTAYDAAFNTWVTDITDNTNRGKVNSVLSIFTILAFVMVFVIAMFTYDAGHQAIFFIILGIIPIVIGIISLFIMKDSPNIVKNTNPNYFKETFYGFRPSVIKKNEMIYICLATSCLLGISQQTFFSYLINFIMVTLGIKDYIIPLAIVIVLAGVLTAVTGILYDKYGRKHFFIPIILVVIASTLVIFFMKFMDPSVYVYVLVVAGVFMLGALLSGSGALMSSFQDYIPKGSEGRFQGVRMCFTVLIPMCVGPLITLGIGLNDVDTSAAGFAPPFEIFLAATIIAALALVPAFFVRRDADRLRKAKLEEKLAEESAAQTLLPENQLEVVDETCNCTDCVCENTESAEDTSAE